MSVARHINCLPDEVLARIFSLLPPLFTLSSVSLVCERFRRIVHQEKLRVARLHLTDLRCSCGADERHVPESGEVLCTVLPSLARTVRMKFLQVLNLQVSGGCRRISTFISDVSENSSGGLSELRIVTSGATPSSIVGLIRNSRKLKILELYGFHKFDFGKLLPSSIDPVTWEILQEFTVVSGEESNSTLPHLSILMKFFPSLRKMNVVSVVLPSFWSLRQPINGERIFQIASFFSRHVPVEVFPNLTTLSLFRVPGQGFENLRKVLAKMPRLKHLFVEIDHMSNVQPFGIGLKDCLRCLPTSLETLALAFPR
jgi:hypothetical protein